MHSRTEPSPWRRVAIVVISGIVIGGCQGQAVSSTAPGASPSDGPTGSGQTGASPLPTPDDAACRDRLADEAALAVELVGAAPTGSSALAATLGEALACLGVRVVPATIATADLEALLDGSEPFVVEDALDDFGPGGDGLLFDLDSLIADLADQGLQDVTGAPATRSSFDAAVTDLAAGGPEGSAARLLQELGRARVAASGVPSTDPTWGEPRFDALQFLIFGLALTSGVDGPATVGALPPPGIFAAPRFAAAAGGSPLQSLGQRFRSGAGVLWRSVRFSLCAGRHAVHTHLRTFATPTDLWHDNGRDPSTDTIEFILTRNVTTDAAWRRAGCEPPPPVRDMGNGEGPIVGKTVAWSNDAAADEHGTLSGYTRRTAGDGTVHATYQTVRETAPRPDQIPPNEQTEPVTFSVQVLDLVPGLPNTIAVMPSATKAVTIHWYEPANYKVTVDLNFVGTDDAFWSTVIVEGEWLLRPTGSVDAQGRQNYVGSGMLTYATNPLPGNCKFTYSGAGTMGATGQALIPDPDHPAPLELALAMQLNLAGGDTIIVTPCPKGGTVSSGKIALIVLFVTASMPTPSSGQQVNWWFKNWVDQGGGVWEAQVVGTCGLQGICRLDGTLRLESVAP